MLFKDKSNLSNTINKIQVVTVSVVFWGIQFFQAANYLSGMGGEHCAMDAVYVLSFDSENKPVREEFSSLFRQRNQIL